MVKRDKYDAVFSDLIRERANYTCEACGTHIPEGNRQAAHCAHIAGRKNQATRYDSDNAVCLCAKHHFYYTDHPLEFAEWLKYYLGETRYEIVRDKANRIKKWGKGEKDEMLKHYRAELKRLRKLREQGETGFLEFTNWE